MAHEKIVVGVDIGSTKIAVIAAQGAASGSRHNNIEILGFSEVPVPAGAVVNGSVENIKQVGGAVREALQEAAALSDLDIGIVNVSFSGSHVKVSAQSDGVLRPSASTGEEVTQRDVDQLVDDMYRARTEPNYDVLHVLPMDFVVDNATGVKEPVGRTGIKLGANFLIISANNQSIQRTRKSLFDADNNLKCDKMVYAPLATGLAVLTENEMKAGIALVDIGDHTTDLIIYQDKIVRHIVSFPIGGRHITSDLATGCGIQPENAEQLKKVFGTALSEDIPLNIEIFVNFLAGRPPKQVLKKNVALIIEERLKEIAAMVYGEIINSGYQEKLIGGIVLTGGSANIPDIELLFEKVTDLSVRVGFPENLAHTVKADAVSNASFATAIGLAWAGIKAIDPRVKSVCKPSLTEMTNRAQATVEVKRKEEKEPREELKKNGRFFWDNLLGKKDENTDEY
ncbi:Cell division protein FtsA [Dyadobacter sp. CECT 9275]|uniref:Cell division protein FtsA n=1 Tax=Dyadobacter helix TaxID=2822344 RepID=A0A916ND57_9BACT|nr:cell division protein FtsA [Dyadobacter sp. CECT 9275]CAG5008717.1 Cell division protein FtsA [Dyadobacter sp. CECT 9275]